MRTYDLLIVQAQVPSRRSTHLIKYRAIQTSRQVAHLLSLASGGPDISMPAEFIVLRKGFVFSLPHARSPGWEETYGSHGDPYRRYQVR